MSSATADIGGSLRRIGVVGAGVIGSGVAQALAQTEHDVILVDISSDVLTRVEGELRRSIRFHHLVAGGAPRQDVDRVLARIQFSQTYDPLADAAFVIENVTESWPVKREVYALLDDVCAETASLAANTSAIPITKIAESTRAPDRVVGIHFMNPVPLKPVVEVIRGRYTSERTLASTRQLLGQMEKEAIVVGDSPGFVSNRVLMLTVNEAAFLVHEEVASAQDVDEIFKGCFGHPMGPLATADLIGIDTVLNSIEVLQDEFADDKYSPCPLLRTMVAAGDLGRKSGRGFFEYPALQPPQESAGAG
jgi:3-hydroxybutyryl-CoA dehydrogenase